MNPIYKFELNRESVNLLDPLAIVAGRILDPGNGAFYVDSNYQTTGNRIAVTPGTTYAIKDKNNHAVVVPVVVFYEPDGSYSYGSTNVSQFTIPNNGIGYIRFSFPITVNARDVSFAPSNQSYTPYGPIAYPIYKDDLAKDFEKESGQEFFRAKLSGKLTFTATDYDWIVGCAFDFQFVLEIFISYNAGQTWTSYWRGTFWKTDCEFDNDAKTVVVQPTVLDQYNDVLAGMDKEYNLIELAPEIAPVKADKRPMVQVYVPGQSVIGCFLSGMWWEQEAEPESDETKLVNDFKFSLNKVFTMADVSGSMSPQLPELFGKSFVGNNRFTLTTPGTTDFPGSVYTFRYFFQVGGGGYTQRFQILRNSDSTVLWQSTNSGGGTPIYQLPLTVTLTPVSGTGATGNVTLYVHETPVYSRFVLDTPQISGLDTYPIPADDIVENNRNYHRVIGYYFPDTIYFSTSLTTTPNQWGLYQPGQYYQQPYILGGGDFFPVARNGWGRLSIWFMFYVFDWIVEESGRQPFTIRHAYPLASVISVLLARIAPGVSHIGNTDYSQFLYGTNFLGIEQTLLITPKSNIVSAGYDQPAQKAPITLKNVLDMLRDCFRCYWFVDDQNRFRIEHIQYFRNGGSYSGSPVVGIDLTAEKVTRNNKAWAFARDQYKFDKPDMAARYQFGWMDDVTQLFDGFPIDIVSKYVNPGKIEQIDVARFTSDIDYILLNPGDVSKDGFVLLSAILTNVSSGDVSIDVSAITSCGSFIGSDGKWSTTAVNKYYGGLVDVTAYRGKNYKIVSSGGGSYAFVKSGVSLGNNVDFATGWSAYEAMPGDGTEYTGVVPVDAVYLYVYLNSNGTSYRPRSITILGIQSNEFVLPYFNYVIGVNDHYLQNAYVAFCFLQRYYAYDMPASRYQINGTQMYAQGVKKLKNQSIGFPALYDPDLLRLIKTNLGNGVIEKLSVNLSSRNANATLHYDTE